MFAQRYRLMPAAPVAPDVVGALLEARATRIQRRDRCHRVTALLALSTSPTDSGVIMRRIRVLVSGLIQTQQRPHNPLSLLRAQHMAGRQ
jgi:hypothetical protein